MSRESSIWVAAAAVVLAACDSGGPSAAGRTVSFSVATRPSAAGPAPAGASVGPLDVVVGSDVIVYQKVELVLREIELERADASSSCGDDGVSGDSDGHDDDCEEINVGPILLDLPLGPGPARQFTVSVDTGTYDELEMKIHKPDNDPGDDMFLQDHPDLQGISVRVTGTFNGTPFVYTSDLDAEQEVDLDPPLTVTEAGPTDLTLMVDIDGWFLDASGTALVDPATALKGQPNEDVVKNNIEASIQAFEDEDHDGEDDHSDDNSGSHG